MNEGYPLSTPVMVLYDARFATAFFADQNDILILVMGGTFHVVELHCSIARAF